MPSTPRPGPTLKKRSRPVRRPTLPHSSGPSSVIVPNAAAEKGAGVSRVEPENAPDELIVAKLAAPHGLKGAIKAIPLTDFPEALTRFKELTLQGADRQVVRLQSVRVQGPSLVFQFEGIDTIEAAELLRGAEVKIPRSEAHPLPPGHYYIGDIVGMNVFAEDGRPLGAIREVRRTGSNDIYITEQALVPAIREAVTEIDVPGRRMVVLSTLVVEG